MNFPRKINLKLSSPRPISFFFHQTCMSSPCYSLSTFSISKSFSSAKPLIVLCPDQELNAKGEWILKFPEAANLYVTSLQKAGAEVLVLKGYDHNHEELLRNIDGWLIPGGLDIDPHHYNAKKHPKTESLKEHSQRFDFEAKFYRVITKAIPILGICYGSQLLNVLNGNYCDKILIKIF